MIEIEYLSIAEFAEKAGVSKQAIYKQVNNENSQIAPFVLREGRKIFIKISALSELYNIDIGNLTFTTSLNAEINENSTPRVEERKVEKKEINPENQPINPNSTQKNQPISTDYIEFLKTQLASAKAEKAEVEQRLNNIIQEKDSIIKEQSTQLSLLAQQVAQIADKALITTSQQQLLSAVDKADKGKIAEPDEMDVIETEPIEKVKRKSFIQRLFGK